MRGIRNQPRVNYKDDKEAVRRLSEYVNQLTNSITEQVDLEQFGAKGDGVSDDTVAIQAAIDSFGDSPTQQPGVIWAMGSYCISATLLFHGKSIEFRGEGWGSSSATPQGSYIKWIGAAGTPMIQVKNSQGFLLYRMRLIGDSTAKPSAAVNFNQAASVSNSYNRVQDVWIGGADFDTNDDNEQFTAGVLFDGQNSNNSQMILDNVRIRKCAVGVDVDGTLYAHNYFSNLYVDNCTTAGLRYRGDVFGHNWVFSANAVDCISGTTAGDDPVLDVTYFGSETAERMLTFGSTTGRATFRRSSFVPDAAQIHSDGRIIDNVSNGRVEVTLDGFRLVAPGGYAGPTPVIRLQESPGGAATKSLYLRDTAGIAAANIDMNPGSGPGNVRYIDKSDSLGRSINLLADSETLDFSRHDIGQVRLTGMSGTLTKANNLRGQATFATAGTVAVTFGTNETDATYFLEFSGDSNETFWWSAKATTGFTINSSNASSTAVVDWFLIR